MNVKYKLNLDVYKDRNYESIIVAQNDDKSRSIECKLYANSQPVTISDNVTAAFNATVDNVIVAENVPCIVADNAVKITLAKSMLQLAGMMKCELVLSENDTILTSQHFSVFVNKSVINTKSKYEPTGSNLATEAAVAKAKAEAIEYFETELTDIDETVTMKINLKADKDSVDNAVAQLSKQIADNKSSADESISTLSQTVTDNKTATDKSLAAKYNSSNIESGSGSLAPGTANYEGCEGSFNYVKNGKVITVSVNITKLIADKTYTQMAGLPFRAINESKYSSIAVYSTTNKLRNVRLDGTWLFISTITDKFAENEKINFIITYIRQ